ncbi:outer membrane receptor protein involved in Fe transport [Breznakibacter xylanolyticus]|uniref:Outer membrane receptor protein involved in Fe transport n=1 Tax=Breznakibacter xylanolyticus TaxID=990 RepID=A0A2W7N857_9BACT|nr:TonB-dependent receptor [Breznakibacter xylanolyticus]PZX14387.1 outer membrane receptor protein involved in Fe transport [Breznakibacter xylanolyticus]
MKRTTPFARLKMSYVILWMISLSMPLMAQQTQTIRGQIIDKANRQPLPGATVVVPGSTPPIGTTSSGDGWFKLTNISVGRVNLEINFLGYQPVVLKNLELTSGKELLLNIEMEESTQNVGEVTVKASKPKTSAINDMALISARSFTVEETEKYAGSRGDVARMASNFAGVSFANDSRNDIIIRGNSPQGLLWRLDDVDIPNPNHFAENGTTGGPVGMLNNNVLRNSDFFTGAFPAEYGNALSGVFDLRMRNGNNEQYEHLFQIGFNGFEGGSEGPISRAGKSSYLVNYRYSTLAVFDKIGFNMGTSGIPYYQDVTFKLHFPTRKGEVSMFGLGGKSSILMLDSKQADRDLYSNDGQDLDNRSKMGATGISYLHYLTPKTYAKVTLSALYQNGGTDIDTLDIQGHKTRTVTHDISEYRLSAAFTTGTKFSASLSSKAGISIDQMGYDMYTQTWDDDIHGLKERLNTGKPLGQGGYLLRSYAQFISKMGHNISITPGVNLLHHTLSHHTAIEPRLGASWQYAPSRKINVGYGMHAKTHPLSVYYLKTLMANGQAIETNKHLDFTKSHQMVAGHDWNINHHMRIKTEVYYQWLYDVPVETAPSYFSLINGGAHWGIEAEDSLVNRGTGNNYGLELTLEHFLNHGYYYLVTASLFESTYRGSDAVTRNTAFNGNYVVNLLGGKEFKLSPTQALSLDVKVTMAGGKRRIPIDEGRSRQTGETEYDESQAFETRHPDFFKTDFKISYKINKNNITQEWQLYFENLTDHKNVLNESYSQSKNQVVENYQLGFFPMMQYRITF